MTQMADDTTVGWWLRTREVVPNPRRSTYDSLMLWVARSIWLKHNDRIFSSSSNAPAQLVGRDYIERCVEDWCSTT
jgi:hypothetical protein